MYASKATKGFYDPGIHGLDMPPDAVEIPDEQYINLMQGQSSGLVIDWSGELPVCVEPAGPSNEQKAIDLRAERDLLLRNVYDVSVIWVQRELRLAAGDGPRITALNAKLAELDAYAVALQDVPEQPGFPTTINWPTPPTRSL